MHYGLSGITSNHFKTIIVGGPGVGKTSLLHRIGRKEWYDSYNITLHW